MQSLIQVSSILIYYQTFTAYAPTAPKIVIKVGTEDPFPTRLIGEMRLSVKEGVSHLGPAIKSIFARNDQLGICQRKLSLFGGPRSRFFQAWMRGFNAFAGILLPRMMRVQKLFGLILEALETGIRGKRSSCHTILLRIFARCPHEQAARRLIWNLYGRGGDLCGLSADWRLPQSNCSKYSTRGKQIKEISSSCYNPAHFAPGVTETSRNASA